MQQRWSPSGYLGMSTAQQEYNRFREQVTPVLEEIRGRDAMRRATIISVSTVSVGQVYIVDFRSTSYDQNDNVVDQRVYTATIEVAFRPLDNLTREQMIINPTGFTVVNYSLAEKDQ
jgi:type IV secretory pathway component VirB8